MTYRLERGGLDGVVEVGRKHHLGSPDRKLVMVTLDPETQLFGDTRKPGRTSQQATPLTDFDPK